MQYDFTLQTDSSIHFGNFIVSSPYNDGQMIVQFSTAGFYGAAAMVDPVLYLATNRGGVIAMFIVSTITDSSGQQIWNQLSDQTTSQVWTRSSSSPTSFPTVMPSIPRIPFSFNHMITHVSKLYQLTPQENEEFVKLLDGEKIRTPFAIQQTTTKEIESVPRLYRYRKVYNTLLNMVKQRNGIVKSLGLVYKQLYTSDIWDVTFIGTYCFRLKNRVNNNITAVGIQCSFCGDDQFWILFENTNQLVWGITDDGYATMSWGADELDEQ